MEEISNQEYEKENKWMQIPFIFEYKTYIFHQQIELNLRASINNKKK